MFGKSAKSEENVGDMEKNSKNRKSIMHKGGLFGGKSKSEEGLDTKEEGLEKNSKARKSMFGKAKSEEGLDEDIGKGPSRKSIMQKSFFGKKKEDDDDGNLSRAGTKKGIFKSKRESPASSTPTSTEKEKEKKGIFGKRKDSVKSKESSDEGSSSNLNVPSVVGPTDDDKDGSDADGKKKKGGILSPFGSRRNKEGSEGGDTDRDSKKSITSTMSSILGSKKKEEKKESVVETEGISVAPKVRKGKNTFIAKTKIFS